MTKNQESNHDNSFNNWIFDKYSSFIRILDEEMDMEDDENNGFMVPHGYLSSDEENQEENGKIELIIIEFHAFLFL